MKTSRYYITQMRILGKQLSNSLKSEWVKWEENRPGITYVWNRFLSITKCQSFNRERVYSSQVVSWINLNLLLVHWITDTTFFLKTLQIVDRNYECILDPRNLFVIMEVLITSVCRPLSQQPTRQRLKRSAAQYAKATSTFLREGKKMLFYVLSVTKPHQ